MRNTTYDWLTGLANGGQLTTPFVEESMIEKNSLYIKLYFKFHNKGKFQDTKMQQNFIIFPNHVIYCLSSIIKQSLD